MPRQQAHSRGSRGKALSGLLHLPDLGGASTTELELGTGREVCVWGGGGGSRGLGEMIGWRKTVYICTHTILKVQSRDYQINANL